MEKFFIVYFIFTLIVTFVMLVRIFEGPGVYDRFSGILVVGANITLLLILIGFIDGRLDMYVDIAISYAILGFITSIALAKFLGSRGE